MAVPIRVANPDAPHKDEKLVDAGVFLYMHSRERWVCTGVCAERLIIYVGRMGSSMVLNSPNDWRIFGVQWG